MFLSRFRVRGYKCLEDVDLPLTPIHVLIGPNNCGKTSLLEAISAFYGRLKTPSSQWFPDTASARDVISYGSKTPSIDLAGKWSPVSPPGDEPAPAPPAAGYGYSIVVPASGTSYGVMDQWVRPPASKDAKEGLARAAVAYPHGAGNPTTEDRAAQAAFRETIQTMLQPAPVYRFDARRLAEPCAPSEERRGRLDADGYGLATLLDELQLQQPDSFIELRTEFCRLLPEFQHIHLQTAAASTQPKKSSRRSKAEDVPARGVVFETRWGRMVPAREASAGSLFLLAMLTLARVPDPPTILLIENPEQGIYPKRLSDIIRPLKQAAYRTEGRPFPQIIFSTHSPYVLGVFDPEEVTLLSRQPEKPHGPVRARPLRDAPKIPSQVATGGARLGELWYNLGEEGLFAES